MAIILTVLKSSSPPLAKYHLARNQKPDFHLVSGLDRIGNRLDLEGIRSEYSCEFWTVARKQWSFFQFLFPSTKSARNGLYSTSSSKHWKFTKILLMFVAKLYSGISSKFIMGGRSTLRFFIRKVWTLTKYYDEGVMRKDTIPPQARLSITIFKL